MANSSDRIRNILNEAEGKLLEYIGECARAGDLPGIDAGRTAVGRLREISSDMRGSAGKVAPAKGRESTKKDQIKRRSKKHSKLPRFEIRGTTLCRVGWSKKKGEEYVHKVPQSAVHEVIDAISSLGQSNNGPITGEQIISKSNQRAAVSIPSYQVYVVIGWLRDQELIEQLGREGYRILDGLRQGFDSIWKQGGNREN